MGNAGREMGMYRLLILSQRDVLGQKWQRLSFAACKHIVYPHLRALIASVALPGHFTQMTINYGPFCPIYGFLDQRKHPEKS